MKKDPTKITTKKEISKIFGREKSITEEKIALKKVQKKISTKKAERKLLFQKEILFKIIRVCLKKKREQKIL